MEMLPEVDPEVAKKLLDQVPELSKMAQAVLDDAAKAYDAALSSNNRSMELVHEGHRKALDILHADMAITALPSSDRGLSQPAPIRKLPLSETRPTASDQNVIAPIHTRMVSAVRT